VAGLLDSGATVALVCLFGGPPAPGLECRVEVVGSQGALRTGVSESTVEHATVASNGQWTVHRHDAIGDAHGDGFAAQWATFTQVARGFAKPGSYPTLADGLRSAAATLAAQRSMLTGRRTTVPGTMAPP
jgi:predicted dehydrogenase